MYRNLLIFVFLLAFSAGAFSSVTVLYPVETSVESGSSIEIGSVAPGQTFVVSFSDNSGFQSFEWDSLTIDDSSFPEGWRIESIESNDTSLVATFYVPANVQSNIYRINFMFSNRNEPNIKETFTALVVVKESLFDVSFSKKSEANDFVVGEKAVYSVLIRNNSIADQRFRISSTLPTNWFSEQTISLKPNTSQEIVLEVEPMVYGVTDFSFNAVLPETGVTIKSFRGSLNVKPTLKGKFSAGFSGFPFFTFSLLPYQLLNSFLGLVLPK